ncbi:ATP-binding protein [Piscinibacter sp.]|uniref:ATP-binding protein n=1 Tax=Piscinibacter sp. TaxID=1903157 RepID=UPI002ED22EA7
MHLLLAHRVCVRAAGMTVELAPRDAALLAWLALEGPTPRARLAALLWPASEPALARNTLRQRLFQLRKQVGADLISGTATLALAAGVGHDLDDSNDLLGDVTDEIGGEFNAWLEQQRARRRSRLRTSLAELCTMAEQAHDWAEALNHAQELLALEPLSEAAHRRVMRLHYLSGDRAAALLAFDRCERMLKDEVGARPSAEALALLATIDAATPPPSASPAAVVRPPRLVGRDTEWQALRRHWAEGTVVWLDGEGGLGKSRLLADAAAAWSAAGERVVRTGARPGDADLPYALLGRCLRGLLPQATDALAPGVRAELARLLPELGDAAPASGSAARFAHAVESVFERVAANGLVGVIVDDLHLADDASAETLMRLSAGPGLRWIFAGRGAELRPGIVARLDALAAEHRSASLRLAPLDAECTAELLDSLRLAGIGGAAQALQLHRHTGGNPMFVLEAVRALCSGAATSGLPALPVASQVILRRIGQLSMPAVRLARCAALAGQDFSAALASRVLQVPALDLTDAWHELDAAQVLRDGAFTHDLIHEAALASVPAPIACELHALIGRDLESHGGEPTRVATHWLAAGQPVAAAPHLQRAGEQALARFRYAEAAQRLEQAGAIRADSGARAEAFDLFFAAADAAATLGEPGALDALVERLAELADDDARRARAAYVRAVHAFSGRRLDEALAIARDALPGAQRSGLADVESELRYLVGVIHWDRREIAAAIAHVEPAVLQRRALPAAAQGPEHLSTLIVMIQALGSMLAAAGRFADADALAREAFALAEQAERPHDQIGAAAEIAVRRADDGDPADALRWSERGLRAVEGAEFNRVDHVRLAMAHGNALLLAGRWGEALAQLDALAQTIDLAAHRYGADIVVRRAQIEWLAGRRDLAMRALRAALDAPAVTLPQRLAVQVMQTATGMPGDAVAQLELVAAVDDVALRSRLLVRLTPALKPDAALPVLGLAAGAVREGARGLWLSMQSRSAALLARTGRHAEAAQLARAAWRQHESGLTPAHPFAEFAADLAEALACGDAALAAHIAQAGRDWMQRAIATLPEAWRDNARMRHPLTAALARGI